MNNDRQIRLFVSSTFLDMQAERNHLVTVVFPQLRRLCESRGVTWGEVDLRWGVTDEDAAEGKILPICFEEINRCRPYFISLLGERYGWVPQSIPEELLKREAWLREELTARKSVTELEALHGALRNPALATHAYFYFRDPTYLQSISEPEQRYFASEKPEDQAKLKRLKERIRQSGLPVREDYPDAKTLGELVLADLTVVINECWPEGSQPDPLTREALDHAAYARSRQRVYIGRPEYFTRLDAYAAGSSDQPLVILGESGVGKSALLANWAARYRQAHPDAFVFEHYIGATPASADWAAMLRRILGEFKRWLGLTQDIPERPDALRSAFPDWLHMAAARSRVILVLDAFNQLEDRDAAPDLAWLPPVMPENVRLIISTLPSRALDEIIKRHWPSLKVEPLRFEERRRLVVEYLAQHAKKLSSPRVDRIVNAAQSANPLYLRVLLDEMRIFGVHERLEERIGYYLQANSPYELYRKVIARWKENYGAGTSLVSDTLSLLWAARRGLTEAELLDTLGCDGQPMPRAKWSPLFLAMSDTLVNRSGLLTFAHGFLRAASRDVYLPTESHQQEAHIRLADYFECQPLGPRQTDELPWQLEQAGAWLRLGDTLRDLAFLEAAWLANRFEVTRYWAQVERHSHRRLLDAFRDLVNVPVQQENADLIWNAARVLEDSGHGDQALALWRALIEYGRQTGDQHRLSGAVGNAGVRLKDLGQLDAAMELMKEQERICLANGDMYGLQNSLGNQGLVAAQQGKLDEAMRLHRSKEKICREIDHQLGIAASLGNQAMIMALHDSEAALRLHLEELRICRSIGDRAGIARSFRNQALISERLGNFDHALALLRDSELGCAELGNKVELAKCLTDQARIFEKQAHPEFLSKALLKYTEAQKVLRDIGDRDGLARSLRGASAIHILLKQPEDAISCLDEAQDIFRESGNQNGVEACVLTRAVVLLGWDDRIGLELLSAQEARLRESGHHRYLIQCLLTQVPVLMKQGKLVEALEKSIESEALCRKIDDGTQLAFSLSLQAKIRELKET
jgi:tetratricopeptide (TPR) repeat protein